MEKLSEVKERVCWKMYKKIRFRNTKSELGWKHAVTNRRN